MCSSDLFGKRLNDVRLRGAAETGTWSANVAAKELAGDLSYRTENRGRLTARLKNGVTIVVEERRSLEDDAADPGWNYAVEKFRGLTRDLLDVSAGERLIDAVHHMDAAPSVAALVAATKLNN